MKRFIFPFAVLMTIVASISFGQSKSVAKKIFSEKNIPQESYLMDAHPLLEKFYKANGIDFSKVPAPVQVLRKTAWNFSVGTQKNWYAQDLTTNGFYSDPTTCRGVGQHCYVFVEDSSWGKHVDQAVVDSIISAFDNRTPADPTKGVYEMDVNTFGDPPDVDGDPKIIIVVLNIRDGYNGSGGFTAGYFSPVNEYSTTTFANSNVGEFYYMDCNPLDFMGSSGAYYRSLAMQITAHEFQHMIQWNYHRSNPNLDFYNEGCSMIAEVVCGYPLRLQDQFVSQTNVPSFLWNNNPPNNTLSDYGRAARFFLYVKEQCGVAALGKFVQSKLTDDAAFSIDVLPNLDPSKRTFPNFTVDWWVANYLNDKSIDPKWGYDYPNLTQVSSTINSNPNVSNYQGSVYKQGVSYYTFIGGKNLTFNSSTNGNTDIKLKAIEVGPNGKQVIDVPTNTQVSLPEFGTTYPNLTFMVYHNNKSVFSSGPYSFTFSSTGESEHTVKELAYDNSEPTGILDLAAGDSVAVAFDGFAGATVDSIRVALRNNLAPVHGGIYVAATTGTHFGSKKLAGPLTINGNSSPGVPYPVPWPNWVTVDLRSSNIDASNPFIVMFAVEGAYPGSNRIMITDYKSSSSYHSFFYDNASGSWIYYSDSGNPGYIFLNLIRAYVSYGGTTGVKQTVELIPSAYKLNQNYPNPFNPSTIISYELPKTNNVQIKVYDALGQEVRSLVDEAQYAGTHNILWDGANNYGQRVSSGIYFYRIVAGDFVQTKKMILMK